jgi:NodT family efflux transporter outer membrane factor (OMF) lipoprotein
MKALNAPLIAIAATALAACAVGPEYQKPDVPLTPAYQRADVMSSTTADSNWWLGFHDPLLEQIISRVQAQNLDLAQSAARVEQARAAALRAGAQLLPSMAATSSASETRQSLKSPIGEVADAVGAPRRYETYSVGAEASWEIDLFGGIRRSRDAALADARSAQLSDAAARISITAEAADAYLALRGLQAQREIANSQTLTQQHLLDLVQLRFGQGVSAQREVQMALADLEKTRSTIPPLNAAIDAQLNRLDILMGSQAGTYRNELAATAPQPVAPLPSGNATPSDLLRHRPDIVAAERRLAAADARIGSALAGYYPSLSLGGLFGVESVDGSSLFTGDALQAQALIGLRWRLFDFGRVDAEVAMARGREAESLAAYRASVLRATEDVENALSRLVNSREESAALARQIAALTVAREQSQTAYEAGASALIDVLDADRELLTAANRLAIAQANESRAAVASYRALGGGWNG